MNKWWQIAINKELCRIGAALCTVHTLHVFESLQYHGNIGQCCRALQVARVRPHNALQNCDTMPTFMCQP